jgi:hypothetical protein
MADGWHWPAIGGRFGAMMSGLLEADRLVGSGMEGVRVTT